MRTLFSLNLGNYDTSWPTITRPSARAIIVRNGKVALTHSLRYNYYKLPGGGIENGETKEDAVIRETKEETGLTIKRETLKEFGFVRRVQKDDITQNPTIFCQENYYYTCEVEEGVCEPSLEEDEKLEHLVFEWVDPIKAIEVNRKRNHGSKDPIMIAREARILEILAYNLKQISPDIWCLPAEKNPLSADVFLIYGFNNCYVYDVGSSEKAEQLLNGINNKTAIISHFHSDHSTNLKNINLDCLIDGKLNDEIVINDGVNLELSNIINTHCKNSIVMNINNEYLLVGDSLYSGVIDGHDAYNVQKLNSTIEALENIETQYVVQSHSGVVITKKEALEMLKNIYSKRIKTYPYVFV